MAKHIPFVYSERDCELVRRFYSDSEVVRIALQSSGKVREHLPPKAKVWVDTGVDGYHLWPGVSNGWLRAFDDAPGADKLGWSSFQTNPPSVTVNAFVQSVLDKCLNLNPDWISVPQLPGVIDTSRNKINRDLAKATAKWKGKSKFKGALVLPIVLTHQEQTNLKGARDKKTNLALQCYERAGADGYWVVESSLADWTGSKTYEQRRFKGVLSFHEEILAKLPGDAFSIGGPYWALNLVMWARGLVDYPAIGVGGRYQYLLPGGAAMQPKRRVALVPLRRPAIVSAKLESWLRKLPNDPDYAELRAPQKDRALRLDEAARVQVARFYKRWFGSLAKAKPSGRALALFQDFSSAYVVGKALEELPPEEKTARRPERLAEQLMLFCMPSS